ncbi:MAG: hypothetical protein IKQ71_11455 [Lachnospiraceae bacterium]|nr:hypothetical protein [Lachnospiraceae bacterium]
MRLGKKNLLLTLALVGSFTLAGSDVKAAASKNQNIDTVVISAAKKTTKKTTKKRTKKNTKKNSDTSVSKDIVQLTIGGKTENLVSLDGGFSIERGILYFETKDKAKVKNTFFNYKGNIYYADSTGKLSKGWQEIKGKYFFFDRNNGKLSRCTFVNSVYVDKNGVASSSTESVERIKAFIKARKLMENITSPSDSKADKTKKCFNWVIKCRYKIYRNFMDTYKSNNNWDVLFACDEFDKGQGDCVSDAAAFAYLAVECGWSNVSICCDSKHSWCDIGGRLYDPLFAECKSFEKNYNAKYYDYRSHASYKKTL